MVCESLVYIDFFFSFFRTPSPGLRCRVLHLETLRADSVNRISMRDSRISFPLSSSFGVRRMRRRYGVNTGFNLDLDRRRAFYGWVLGVGLTGSFDLTFSALA